MKIDIPEIEKKIGDLKRQSKIYDDAILHYTNSILAIKFLFDEEGLISEEKANELIEKIAVKLLKKFNFSLDSRAFEYGILLHAIKRMGKCYIIL